MVDYDKGKEPAFGDKDEIQSLVHGILSDAHQYVESELAKDRALATDFYHARPLGNEEEGRSQIVVAELRNAVRGVIPSLMRVFFGGEQAVEFVPTSPEKVDLAEQVTRFIEYAFERAGGFGESQSVLMDGLLKRIGAFKWGWDDSSTATTYRVEGITQEQAMLLMEEEGVELVSAEELLLPDGTPGYNIEVSRIERDGMPWVSAVPTDELLISRDARDLESAQCVAHRMEMTRSDLLRLGIAADVIDEYGGMDGGVQDNEEAIARNEDASTFAEVDAGKANEKHIYTEAWMYLAPGDDKPATLRKICTIGPNYHIVKNVPATARPFAVFTPVPEPHTLIGQSWFDLLKQVQYGKTMVTRSMLDSLALAIHPRTTVVEGAATVEDVMNTEIGAVIRQRAPGMVAEFTHSFVGKEAFPVLQYFDELREEATGQNKGAIGLDADALQSSTKAAVGAAVTASQAQIEMLARQFAEQTLAPLFRGLFRLFIEKQPRAKTVRLLGKWVEIDPRVWDADMDVTVRVALGAGMTQERIAGLLQIVQKQEQLMQVLGPQNPITGLVEYRNTLAKITELLGWRDASRFFKPIDEQALAAQQAQAAQTPPPPTPEQVIAQAQVQIEQMKAEREIAIKQAELELKRQEMLLRDDRERDKQAADIQLRKVEMELKHAADLNDAQLRAEIQRERATSQAGPQG